MKTTKPTGFGQDNLFASFAYAFGGIFFAIGHERNFRIHCCAVAYVLYFSRYYDFNRGEAALIALLLGLVVICELLNTSIEKAIDMTTPVYNPFAKIAKDVAAGAVLVSAVVSLVVGYFLFWDPVVIGEILADIRGSLLVWVFLIALTLAWIFVPQKAAKRRKEKGNPL